MCFDMGGGPAKPRHVSSRDCVFVERTKRVPLAKPFQQDTLMEARQVWQPAYDLVNLAGRVSEEEFARLVAQLEEITSVSQW